MLRHCWLGDRKGIWPLRSFTPAVADGSSLKDLWGPGLTWSDLGGNKPVKQKTKSSSSNSSSSIYLLVISWILEVYKISGTFVLKTIRSLELSFPRTFVPWNFRSREQINPVDLSLDFDHSNTKLIVYVNDDLKNKSTRPTLKTRWSKISNLSNKKYARTHTGRFFSNECAELLLSKPRWLVLNRFKQLV